MRALCGAVITAGALIGLGITALGIGTRYQYFSDRDAEGRLDFLKFRALDTPLMIIVFFLMVASIIGLGLAFFGLALHHERRKYEREHRLGEHPARSESLTPSRAPMA